MKQYSLQTLKGDLLGGVTAGVVGLPLCLAFGATSGVGPAAGLYGGIVLGILAAAFGGTPTQVSAPTGPMTVVSALIIASEIKFYGSLEAAYGAIILTFALAGIFQIALGALRLGKYIDYLPYPVISGFMSGIGVIVITMQFPDFFGVAAAGKGAIINIINLPNYLIHADYHAFLIAGATLLVALLFPKVTKAIPSTLVALVVGTFLAILMKLDLKVIGEIPSGIPELQIGKLLSIDLNRASHMILPALSLGALGMIDTLLTSVIADKLTRTKHNSNKELVGQGIGNLGAALIGGIPGAGTTVVTVTNTKAGATTRMSGIFQGLFLALVLFVGGAYASQIPYAVLAGLLVSIGFKIIDYTLFRDMKFIPKSDLFIILTVFILTVTWNLLYATAIGFVIASVFFMKKMADTIEEYSNGSQIDRISKKLISLFDNAEDFEKDVYIKQLNGPVFFGFATRIEESIKQLPDIKKLIFDMRNVPYIDQTGLYSMKDAIDDLSIGNIEVFIVGANAENLKMLEGAEVIGHRIPKTNVFDDLEECVLWIHDIEDPKQHDEKVGIHIPSAFTPNEDGKNDHWEIKGLEKYKECLVTIKTDEGIIVYHSDGYETPWDGMFKGKPLAPGKYQYHIELVNGKRVEYIGEVILLR